MNAKTRRDLIVSILFFIAGVLFFFAEKGRYMCVVFWVLSLIFFSSFRKERQDPDDPEIRTLKNKK